MPVKLTPRRQYNFDKMNPGSVKRITIPANDERAGWRALTAAYAFARRHNEKAKRKADRIKFAGRVASSGNALLIHRVQ